MSSILNDNCDDLNFVDSGESESNQSDNNSVKSSSTKSRNKWKWLPFLTFVNTENAKEYSETDDFKKHWFLINILTNILLLKYTAPSDIHTELIRLKTLANEEDRISFRDIPTAFQISTFKGTLVPYKAPYRFSL